MWCIVWYSYTWVSCLGTTNKKAELWIRILPATSKKSKKSLDFGLLFWLFTFEDWCKLPLISKKQKKKLKNSYFVFILSATDEKSRIRIRKPLVRIRGSGSVPKCHESAALQKKVYFATNIKSAFYSDIFHSALPPPLSHIELSIIRNLYWFCEGVSGM